MIQAFIDLKLKFQKSYKHRGFSFFWFELNIKDSRNPASQLSSILDGHHYVLGCYYSNLYQMITYIDDYPTIFYFERYEYVKKVRAQFSHEEVALFLINAYSPLGNIWIKDKVIIKYQLIKNLPTSLLISLGKDVVVDFPTIDFEF